MSNEQWSNVCERVEACALTGAAAFAAGIPGAEILVNGPIWCYFYGLRYLEYSEYDVGLRLHGSQPDNNAIVYGTEECLTKALERLLSYGSNPEYLFIENSCSISLIGDDTAGIAKKLDLPCPVGTMDCGGLVGGFAEGYSKACLKIIKQFVKPVAQVAPGRINLLGLSDFTYNGRADREELCRILTKAGYTINAVPGGGSRIAELQGICNARLNVVCNEELGLKTAQYLQDKYKQPYIVLGMPYGLQGTKKWLEQLQAVLPCEQLEAVLTEIAATEARLTAWSNELRSVWGSLWFDNVVLSASSTTALCLAQALRSEWLDTSWMTVICQNKIENKYCTLADEVYYSGSDGPGINRVLDQVNDVLVLGSNYETTLLDNRGDCSYVSCNISLPVCDEALMIAYPFAGIRGSAHLLQRIWNAYISTKKKNG